MAKMFYTLEETAQMLGTTAEAVQTMVSKGQLTEFRDRDKLIFKKEQVDLLAHKDDADSIPLADSKGGSGLTLALDDEPAEPSLKESPKERSGISIFDTEELDSADPSAVTQVSATGAAQELTMDSVGSGSGLLDLTREGDDTSLGADLLEDVYQQDDAGTVAESDTQAASGLFESTPVASDASAGAAAAASPLVMALAEPYDGTWSGIAGGLSFGAIIVSLFALSGVLLGMVGVTENPVIALVRDNVMMWVGIFAGVVIISAVIGLLLGKKSG